MGSCEQTGETGRSTGRLTFGQIVEARMNVGTSMSACDQTEASNYEHREATSSAAASIVQVYMYYHDISVL